MQKKLLSLILLCFISISAFAQKEYIVIKPSTKGNDVKQEVCDRVHAAVVNSIVESKRFNVVDENLSSTVPGDQTKYALETNVRKLSSIKTVVEGKTCYKGTVACSVNVINIETNTTAATLNIEYTTAITEETPEEAEEYVLSTINDEMKNFLIKEFPLIGEIYSDNVVIKGKKLKECYISLGSEDGIKKGDRFTVHEVKTIVGKEIEGRSIGRLKVVEVYDDMALCEVTWGEKKVKEAMDRYIEDSDDDTETKRLRAKMSLNIVDKVFEAI